MLDHVIVSRKSFKSDDPYDIIMSNIDVVNYLLEQGAEPGELSREALGSYYVDYYEAEVNNGGIDQFVFNTGWNSEVIEHVETGLALMGAKRHAELFSRVRQTMDSLSDEDLAALSDGILGEDRSDSLDALSEEFFRLEKQEKLETLNAAFLRGLPNLEVVRLQHLADRLDGLVATIPNLEERLAERAALAEANKPRYARVIDAICAVHGWELEQITAGDPTSEYQGTPAIGWHFLTNAGHHWMIDLGEKAVIFDADDNELGSVDVSDVPHD